MNDKYKYFIEKAIELGACSAKIVSSDTIKTEPWVELKCRYGCEKYNKSICCPPRTPDYKRTREIIDSYHEVLLIQCKADGNPSEIVIELEHEFFRKGYYKALSFGAGECKLCKVCNLDNCIHTIDARPAMEACGIDVFGTAAVNGYAVRTADHMNYESNRYGIVLIA